VHGTGDSGNSMFAILGNQLVAAADFDFETDRQWTVRVRSTDSGGLSVESKFTIMVTDVSERPRTLTPDKGGLTLEQTFQIVPLSASIALRTAV
jgi:hypothetical protein